MGDFVNPFDSFSLVPLTFVFPSLIFLKVKGKSDTTTKKAWHVFNVVLFSMLAVATTISAIRLIINNVRHVTFSHVKHPTELILQAFVPRYMDCQFCEYRPGNLFVDLGGHENIASNREDFTMQFHLGRRPSKNIKFTLYSPPFTTHSLSMNQRMLVLRCISLVRGGGLLTATVEGPPSPNVVVADFPFTLRNMRLGKTKVRGTRKKEPNRLTKSHMKGKAAATVVLAAKWRAQSRKRRPILSLECIFSSSLRNLVSGVSWIGVTNILSCRNQIQN